MQWLRQPGHAARSAQLVLQSTPMHLAAQVPGCACCPSQGNPGSWLAVVSQAGFRVRPTG